MNIIYKTIELDLDEWNFQDILDGVYEGVTAISTENEKYMILTFDCYIDMIEYYKGVKYFDWDIDIKEGLIYSVICL